MKTNWFGELNLNYYKVIIMTNVIVIKNEYPDDVTQIRNVAWETAGVYDVINTIIASHEIANKIKDEKDITELDIEQNIYGYFGRLIEEIKDEVMERLEHCEGCTCEKIDGKWIYNRTRVQNENDDKTIELINEIITKEDDRDIEYIKTYEDANNLNIVPDGDYKYMIEFFSEELINPKEDISEYGGHFSANEYNGTYIRDCMRLINDIEERALDMKDKYSHLGCDVTVGDYNVGCQYGMAIYVWVPIQ